MENRQRVLNWRDTHAYRHQKNKGRERVPYAVDNKGRALLGVQRYGFWWNKKGEPLEACVDRWVPRRKLGKKMRLAIRSGRARSVYLYFKLPTSSTPGSVTYLH